MALSVRDPQYREALHEFGLYLRLLHRGAGEPPYSYVAHMCEVSVPTVSRYLSGAILPRWNFLDRYLAAYGPEITRQFGDGVTTDLKTRWMAVRDILNPLPALPGTVVAPVRRLTAVPGGERPETMGKSA